MDVYVPQEKTDVIKLLHTPTPHTLLLVPSSIGLLDPEAIFAIGCKTRQSMLAWAEGLRFHKHGQRKLSENLENALNHRFSPQVEPRNESSTTLRQWSAYDPEVNQDRSFDEKRYKLPSRSERFESLHDLCNFYEKRRYLLLEDDPQDDSATAF
ncbi:unnamed protein product [Hymenolepis diminuta]|uniref:Uncharacterized protein n=1 Tax=Hymenolepis diminuta TaxID=6216 RepID=A0A0R3SER4_HYMDI|nr:unnamed protein product [Hymenolepis diminuta]